MEVVLSGLRTLKNWQALADALPTPDSAIQNITPGQPQIRLNAREWQVWEFAKGTVSLQDIAIQLNQPTATIQQAAFRLMLAGLVEEIPLIVCKSSLPSPVDDLDMLDPATSFSDLLDKHKSEAAEKSRVSPSLLQNLVGFLRSKS